jgi:metallophosphoesterase superfamily enzyme
MSVRVKERDLIIPALRAAAASPTGELTTTQLIAILTDEFAPDGQDAEIIDGRHDSYFSQKVRNLVSHRTTTTSMFTKGYALYHDHNESISITELGKTFLGQVPDE